MSLKTKPFDAAKYLDDDETIAAFIDASLEDNTASGIAHALGVVARARGMTQIAKETGISRESLYRSLSATGNPEVETLLRVLKALHLRLTVEPIKAAE
jgi:probable addiction module antidote protein